EILGGVLALKGQGVFHLENAADVEGTKNQGVMQLLYWTAVKLASKEGFKEFSFGRTCPDNTGLVTYKNKWGTIEEDLPVCILSDSPRSESRIGHLLTKRLIGGIFRNAPQFFCRFLGDFLYKHWG
ncbi:MAG: hypothetical protein JKY51_09960, partial [Opitutaceae bacterium]|nr:hypothetical protein [Opitutaceae bacterium]